MHRVTAPNRFFLVVVFPDFLHLVLRANKSYYLALSFSCTEEEHLQVSSSSLLWLSVRFTKTNGNCFKNTEDNATKMRRITRILH